MRVIKFIARMPFLIILIICEVFVLVPLGILLATVGAVILVPVFASIDGVDGIVEYYLFVWELSVAMLGGMILELIFE